MEGEQAIKNLSWLKAHSGKNRQLAESLLLDLDRGRGRSDSPLMEMRERRGGNITQRFGLKFIELMGVLIEARRKRHIPTIKPMLDDLIAKVT